MCAYKTRIEPFHFNNNVLRKLLDAGDRAGVPILPSGDENMGDTLPSVNPVGANPLASVSEWFTGRFSI